jgi:hypothetical protein
MALAERGRYVTALMLKDLETSSLGVLNIFFRQVAQALRARKTR